MLVNILNAQRKSLLLKRRDSLSLWNIRSFSKGFKGAPGLRKAWGFLFMRMNGRR
jgi:hypothetical protein